MGPVNLMVPMQVGGWGGGGGGGGGGGVSLIGA